MKTKAAATSTSAIIGIDVTKAFDTVSHNSIRRGLIRMGIDPQLKTYIMSSLQGNRTLIRLGGHNTRELSFNRGVKQGDPISPILYNIVMDEFIESTNARGHGGTIDGNIKVASRAFDDDVILMEDNPEQMMVSLDRARKFRQDKGIEINPSKCFSATTVRHRAL